jgi:chorismate dehydratase
MDGRLKIGKIPYTNLLPVFGVLRDELDGGSYEFVEGFPSTLNRMVRNGEIDVSPSSSIEYLRDEEAYTYIKGHSISSRGPVRSILLFSRVPVESLGGHEIYATHQSESSVALLRVVLSEFYRIRHKLKITSVPADMAVQEHSAYLSIGDEALLASHRARPVELDVQDAGYRLCTINHNLFYIYDLGDLWLRHTGLPFVFALWIAKKDVAGRKKELFERFTIDLDNAHRMAKERFREIAEMPGLILPPEELVEYWKGIYYGLSEDCLKGLMLFRDYLRKHGLLS